MIFHKLLEKQTNKLFLRTQYGRVKTQYGGVKVTKAPLSVNFPI